MGKSRAIACAVIMSIAAIIGYFIGALLDEPMNGAILLALVSGISCIVYNIHNSDDSEE